MATTIYSSDRFHWHSDTKTLTAEISDLEGSLKEMFFIRSERTGKKELFMYESTEKDSDGDVQVWNFFPMNKELFVKIEKVVIFND